MISKKHRTKCENQGFWPPKPLPKPSQNPLKIEVPKNIRFFIEFCLICVICCKRQHRKFIGPANVLLAFHTFQVFGFRIHFFSKKPTKNPSETTSEPLKNRCRKRLVFQLRFFELSASILEALGPPRWSQVRRAACSARRVKAYRILFLH